MHEKLRHVREPSFPTGSIHEATVNNNTLVVALGVAGMMNSLLHMLDDGGRPALRGAGAPAARHADFIDS